jgi:hypothetical protein
MCSSQSTYSSPVATLSFKNRISIYCNNLEIYYNCKFTSWNWWRRHSMILLEWMERRRDEGCRGVYMRVFLIQRRQVTAILTCAVVICSVYVLLGGPAKADTAVLGGARGWCLQPLMWSSLRRRNCTLAHYSPILDCLLELHVKIRVCDSIPTLITTSLSWVNVICYEYHSLHSLKLILMFIFLHL